MFDDVCTIYNKYTEYKVEKWQRTVLTGVFWEGVRGSNFRKTGQENADSVVILIPYKVNADKEYLMPKVWQNSTLKDVNWTLQRGDMIIKGDIDYEVVESSKELEQFDECYRITKIDNRSFSGDMAHWELGAR